MSQQAFWMMMQGDLGCERCLNWCGDRFTKPCESYEKARTMADLGDEECKLKEERKKK